MGWVQSQIVPGAPAARVHLSTERLFNDGGRPDPVAAAVGALADDPAGLAAYGERLVAAHRPGLAGCAVVAIRFDFQFGCWEFVVVHPSLPRVPPGAELPRLPLEPDPAPPVVGRA